MKHIYLLSSLFLVGGTILTSCSSDESFGNTESIKRIEASICNFQMEDSNDMTRTSYTLGANGYEAVWTAGDILGIYPLGGDQVSFPISDGAGTTNAVFDGGAWALRGTYQYAAYYPFSQENYTISETAIPVSYLGQKQSSNNATSHLAKYDFMAAAATQPSSNGSVILPFKHLGSYLTLPLTLPKAGTYTKLTLTSSSGEFITKGTVDLSAATPTITATETSSSISLDLDNIVLTAGNLVLTVNMMIAPVNLTGSTITITVTDSSGDTYTNTEKAWTRSAAFEANTTYKASRVLSGSGTGGSIEGGGGLEEDDDTPNMHKGHEYVDLGIKDSEGKTIYWATMNLGANSPDAYGDYYYKATTSASAETYVEIDQDYFGNVTYDAANSQWGGSWRLPSKEEFEALINTTNFTWTPTVVNNKNVYRVESKINGNSIILPLAGSGFNDGNLYDTNTAGFYLSGSSTSTDYVINLQIRNGLIQVLTGGNKFVKWSVRPVFTETTKVEEHEFVDLGLPSGLKWATCNIGANLPEEYGDYYAWGEITTKDEYSQATYEHFRIERGTDADGFDIEDQVWDDLGDISGTEYDVAHQKWGGSWRMPTQSEFYELYLYCTWKWGAKNTVYGYKVTGSNGNWIFLPAAGYHDYTSINLDGSHGCYWSSTPDPSFPFDTYDLYFDSSYIDHGYLDYRCFGRSVRPVKE